MKKFLLSLAAIATAATMSAASYTIFDIANPGKWNGDANGFTQTASVGGKSFTITTAKASSTTDLISPDSNTYAWRVYKGSTFTIESTDIVMKQIVITYDNYETDGKNYYGNLTLSEGWTGSLKDVVYTLVGEGTTFTGTAEEKQVRIKTIVVSDEAGSTDEPIQPELPDGIIYQNAFDSQIDGWVKINDENLSDFSGWKLNTSDNAPKCLICNSYYDQENHEANAKIEYAFDLTNYENVNLSVEQAFGFDFPTEQIDNYRLYVKKGEEVLYQSFANFPAKPDKNWSDFVKNDFDLSEFDGENVTIGFEYATDGEKSRAWELRNFVLSGDKLGAVEGIEIDNEVAPVYYNLQGARVANPTSGLYIVVKGNKATKVIF